MEEALFRSERNRTLALTEAEKECYKQNLIRLSSAANLSQIQNTTINQNLFDLLDWLPQACVDLLFLDPPYNLTKSFNGHIFKERTTDQYLSWLNSWLPKLLLILKPTASVYLCGDWRSSTAIHMAVDKYLQVRNRITWEREKGRGAKTGWKNNSEDIWFCTVSENYHFDVDAVKLKRRVIAPYRTTEKNPKDWENAAEGNYRYTHPSNIWTDLTIPFWSMPENTDHPTQKPEKLLAKIILASSKPGDLVLDPFLGSGTTSVVAKKLGRKYIGIEADEVYCCLAEKRLALADSNSSIQGYADGVFWERNSLPQRKSQVGKLHNIAHISLFEQESV
jgi:site-specific DNA-methyltransferase (adenine-specific)